MKIVLHNNDIPKNIKFNSSIAIDTETMGLNHYRDRLCLVQLSTGNGICHLVQIVNTNTKPINLIRILKNKSSSAVY